MTEPLVPRARILSALAAETRSNPNAPKRLVGPDVNYGRELLVALACRMGGWIGWESTNLRRIAGELAFVPLHRSGVRIGGDVEIRVLVNRALDRAMDGGLVNREFMQLGRSLGFRKVLRDSVLELRIAGISPDELRQSTEAGSPACEVVTVLSEYHELLVTNGVTDPAGVFQAALDNFDEQAGFCLTGELFLSPMLIERGLPGRLLERLTGYGAKTLDGDAPISASTPENVISLLERKLQAAPVRSSLLAWCGGMTIPERDDDRLDTAAVSIDMFVAATPTDEMREVLRRIVGEGVRWDEVEIATTDVDTYGIALDALCGRIDAGSTMLHGIPLARTRFGRALERWFAWLENGLPADMLRQALEAGEIGAGIDVEPPVLARELRAVRIGWGRARYEEALLRIDMRGEAAGITRYEDESDERYEARSVRERRGVNGLRDLLVSILGATPVTPERDSDVVVRTSASALAKSTLAWLDMFNIHGNAEHQTCERARTRLEALAELDGASTSFGAALATLRDALSDVRAWPLITNEGKPWSAGGGMLHLTDLAHAGTTDRRRLFVVGLDADSTIGSGRQDALIPDVVRASLKGRIATTSERREERGFVLAAALASLRGRVTLSYASTRTLDGGDGGPAPQLLQIQRLLEHDEKLSYAELRGRLGAPVSSVPARAGASGEFLLDARDVWLAAIADGPLLMNGETLVRGCFSSLDAGMKAREQAQSIELTQFVGYLPEIAGVLDPRDRPERAISPSALEKLAACPLAWFYRYGLSLYPPNDPAWDPDTWLSSGERGTFLHEIFESFAIQFADRRHELLSTAANEVMEAIMETNIAKWRSLVPPPRAVVVDREIAELQRAALSFLEMERESFSDGNARTWRFLEYAFGKPDPDGSYTLSDGSSLNVKGRVDRIDEMPDGSFRVIDYKTGSPTKFRKIQKQGRFNGARQLQPAIYSGVLAQMLNGTVARFEYRFPTERGLNQIIGYGTAELAEARPVITQLLDHVRTGAFVPTNSAADCKYCDVRDICRVTDDVHGNTSSPRARWAADNADGLSVYAGMLARRAKDGDE